MSLYPDQMNFAKKSNFKYTLSEIVKQSFLLSLGRNRLDRTLNLFFLTEKKSNINNWNKEKKTFKKLI